MSSYSQLATFMIICPASFFLGLVFSLFPYDYLLLWSSVPVTTAQLDLHELHLKLLYNSPNLIVRIMHIITAIGILGLCFKLSYKATESNMLFDGGSLVLYMIAVVLYLTNIIKGLRIVNEGIYGAGLSGMSEDQLDDVDSGGYNAETGTSVLGREDNMKVISASNTILALVLVGVLVLQVGQWYAERVEARERKKFLEEEESKKNSGSNSATATGSSPTVRSSGSKKRQ